LKPETNTCPEGHIIAQQKSFKERNLKGKHRFQEGPFPMELLQVDSWKYISQQSFLQL
jgi:hypothetical protein